MKYKARLVAKGCSQRPWFEYNETYSPVVWIEIIHTILAIVPSHGLVVCQMDVKGAYLNGTLKEKVYMHQPIGYEDGTGRVCLLKQTIYGLKQSGHEWNHELDIKLRDLRFMSLLSDPYAYIQKLTDDIQIVTVWVDDLLLFANSVEVMTKLQTELSGIFELIDMGEPNKIIRVKITL